MGFYVRLESDDGESLEEIGDPQKRLLTSDF